MTAAKDIKKKALKELEGLKKALKEADPDLDAVEVILSQLPLFHRILYRSNKKGVLEIYYGHMTLKIIIKCGIIEINERIELWNSEESGYLGIFTPKTLKLECSEELD